MYNNHPDLNLFDIKNVKKILDKLDNNGFKYLCFNKDLKEVNYPDTSINYVRAIKNN